MQVKDHDQWDYFSQNLSRCNPIVDGFDNVSSLLQSGSEYNILIFVVFYNQGNRFGFHTPSAFPHYGKDCGPLLARNKSTVLHLFYHMVNQADCLRKKPHSFQQTDLLFTGHQFYFLAAWHRLNCQFALQRCNFIRLLLNIDQLYWPARARIPPARPGIMLFFTPRRVGCPARIKRAVRTLEDITIKRHSFKYNRKPHYNRCRALESREPGTPTPALLTKEEKRNHLTLLIYHARQEPA